MKSLFKLFFIGICGFIAQSCDTKVPIVDTIPPTYTFFLDGDNFKHEFSEKDDPSTYQVNVKYNIPYQFTFVSYDKGGVVNSEIVLQTERYLNVRLSADTLSSQWQSVNRSFLTRELDWFHQNGVPKTGSFLSGSLVFLPISNDTIAVGESRSFFIRINDFGGQNHNFNQTFNSIPFYVASDNQESKIVEY